MKLVRPFGPLANTPYPSPKPPRHRILDTNKQLRCPSSPYKPHRTYIMDRKDSQHMKKDKTEAYKIIVKQTTINCKAGITKYRALLNIKPKTIYKKIFHPTIESPLDCIQNSKCDILTKPPDIANEIYYTQQKSF